MKMMLTCDGKFRTKRIITFPVIRLVLLSLRDAHRAKFLPLDWWHCRWSIEKNEPTPQWGETFNGEEFLKFIFF